MRPGGHLVSSLVGSVAVYCFFENIFSALVFFLSSLLVDIDHIIDYTREFGIKNFNFHIFCEACYESHIKKVTLVLHSFELLFLLWICIAIFKLNIYWVSFALGITFHYLLDCLFNPVLLFTYFFIYRWRNQFLPEKLFRLTAKGEKWPS